MIDYRYIECRWYRFERIEIDCIESIEKLILLRNLRAFLYNGQMFSGHFYTLILINN